MNRLGEEAFEFGPRLVQGGVRGLAQDAPSCGEDHRPMLAHDPFPISGLAAGLAQVAQAPVPGIGHRWFSRPCLGGAGPPAACSEGMTLLSGFMLPVISQKQ